MTIQTFNTDIELQFFGEQLAREINAPYVIYLQGELGAGKTTLVRGILRGLGYQGNVKSPTYTLIEAYEIKGQTIYHLDLYRLNDPEELEHIGFRDYLNNAPVMLIEWPEKAEGHLPPADMTINISIDGDKRVVTT